MPKEKVFLDHNSTTPLDPEVLKAMLPYLTDRFGNASSPHLYGIEAKAALDLARENIAKNLRTEKHSIIFTSSATESNNLALKGFSLTKNRIHIITQITEHDCILNTCHFLESLGHEVTYLPVDGEGFVNPDDVKNAIKSNTLICSIMHANNEIGTIQPIEEIAKICEDHNILFHTDAAQTLGKLDIDLKKIKIDLLSFSAHKIYGPKGVGGLYLSDKAKSKTFTPLFHGGGHENNFRSGTYNIPGIIGLDKALDVYLKNRENINKKISNLQEHLYKTLKNHIPEITLNGPKENRLIGNLNVSLNFMDASQFLAKHIHLGVSTGSACSSDHRKTSHVLQAITKDENRQKSALRIGIGKSNTQAEIDLLIEAIKTLSSSRSIFKPD